MYLDLILDNESMQQSYAANTVSSLHVVALDGPLHGSPVLNSCGLVMDAKLDLVAWSPENTVIAIGSTELGVFESLSEVRSQFSSLIGYSSCIYQGR